ncbi:MAG: type II secretion system GspH family protein [Fimbriimonadaceae bacterium]|nr:type II secretion system GspH family protein [Fimbriimonadaceae bacterium]
MIRNRRTAGTTLIEVLVVIVIFLIGILAVVQVFPGGFKVLRATRDQSVATALSRAEIERIKANSAQLPEMVLPVLYTWIAGGVVISADTERGPDDIGPVAAGLDQNGVLYDASNNALGSWPYLSGANVQRRVIGEGRRVPAPRVIGAEYGGLLVLQFGPVVFNPQYQSLFQVYGNDMIAREGAPDAFSRRRDYLFYLEDIDDASGQLWLPSGPTNRTYRLSFSAWVSEGGDYYRHDVVDATIPVRANLGWVPFQLSNYAPLGAGETYLGAEFDSVQVQRRFDQLPSGVGFTAGEPYEYKLLDANLGLLLFNPAGATFTERRPGGRSIPLMARVSYDVWDWRILRDEFRVPDLGAAQQKLTLGNLKVLGNRDVDGLRYGGLGFDVADGAGGVEPRDFVLVDLDTGAVVTQDSYRVDRSLGVVTFLDADGDGTNGIQGRMTLPGAAAATGVTLGGRNVRALYHAVGEWSVQILKPAALYSVTDAVPVGVGQYYVGQTPDNPVGLPTRVYFPKMDLGRKVTIAEVWYRDGGGALKLLENVDFVIQGTPPDATGLPYIDIRSVDPGAQTFDYATYGYALRGVRGASVSVRVLHNPSFLSLGGNAADNMASLEQWGRDWRRTETETFLQRGEK